MMMVWRCDLCKRESPERMVRVYVYENGRPRTNVAVSTRLDLCAACTTSLTNKLTPKGDGVMGNRSVPCVVCGTPARATVQVYPNSGTFRTTYTHAGKLCPTHVAPLLKRGYRPGTVPHSTRPRALA